MRHQLFLMLIRVKTIKIVHDLWNILSAIKMMSFNLMTCENCRIQMHRTFYVQFFCYSMTGLSGKHVESVQKDTRGWNFQVCDWYDFFGVKFPLWDTLYHFFIFYCDSDLAFSFIRFNSCLTIKWSLSCTFWNVIFIKCKMHSCTSNCFSLHFVCLHWILLFAYIVFRFGFWSLCYAFSCLS